jgi:hypothetical protein
LSLLSSHSVLHHLSHQVAYGDGPYLHYPDADMYLLYWNLHAAPWLFRWSVQEPGRTQATAARVDWRGRLHALSPGLVDVYAQPRLGRGFGTARFRVLPPLDTILLHLSADTIAVGDTLRVSYRVMQADGRPMPWWGSPNAPWLEGDLGAWWRLSPDRTGDFSYVARRRGALAISVALGRRMTRASLVVR